MIRDPRTYKLIGIAMEVHRQLGPEFLEAVYHEAYQFELKAQKVSFIHEAKRPIIYKGIELSTYYRADFICFDTVIVELKAIQKLSGIETAQVINYLKATKFEVGLLLNFGSKSLEHQRQANTKN